MFTMTIRCEMPPQFGQEMRRQSKKLLELEELVSCVVRAAHAARDKGFYTVSREATTCVDILRRIKSLPLKPRAISASNAFRSLRFLATNGNPKIRSEARSVTNHWRNILSGNLQRVHMVGSCSSTREADLKKKTSSSSLSSVDPQKKKKTSIRRIESVQEFKAVNNDRDLVGSCLNLEADNTEKKPSPDTKKKKIRIRFRGGDSPEPQEAMNKTRESQELYESVKDRIFLDEENSRRCAEALKGLFQVPRALTLDLICTTDIGARISHSLLEHSDADVRRTAKSLLDHWKRILLDSDTKN